MLFFDRSSQSFFLELKSSSIDILENISRKVKLTVIFLISDLLFLIIIFKIKREIKKKKKNKKIKIKINQSKINSQQQVQN